MTDLASSIMNITGAHLPRGEFFELVKAIGEAKSKQEEDRIIMDEIAVLKAKMGPQPTFTKKMKEYLVRLIYCEMLGHDASFGYIKAVELSASSNLLQKRVGYLTASLCLSPDHEFRFMLVNQFTRDMNSINYLEVCAALNAVCRLTTVDTIPAVLNEVTNKLKHEQEAVRKKAVMALQKFYSLQPSSITHLDDRIRRTLCDKDPSVMAAVLCLLLDLIKDNPAPYRDLVPSFVSILKQIIDHRLPRDYDYHRVPAPWVQIHLLRILALLGNADQKTSEGMYEVLVDVMRRADTGINVGYAIVYECVRTVTTIYPNTVLLDAAASSIARFIGSDNHNLKYLGVKGLAAIVKDHPRYAAQHQLAVIDCLEDPDETLKRKTLDLLHRMTNPVNVEFIIAKLLEFLEKSSDVFLRTDLVQRISQSAERYAPSTSWYIQTMTRVFLLAGELVKPEAAHTLMQLIAEGTGEDEEADMQLRKDAVENYVALLLDAANSAGGTAILPDILVQTMSWTLGEYGYLSETLPQADLIIKLAADIAHRPFHDPCTRGFVVASCVKLVAQTGACPAEVSSLLALYGESLNLDLQQRCLEYMALLQHPEVMVAVLPVDASCEDLGVDESLSFLDVYVEKALARGARQYNPPIEQADDQAFAESKITKEPSLNLTPYAKPEKPTAVPMGAGGRAGGAAGGPVAAPGGANNTNNNNLLAGLSLSTQQQQQQQQARPAGGVAGGPKPGLRPVAQIWSRNAAVVGPRPMGGGGGGSGGGNSTSMPSSQVAEASYNANASLGGSWNGVDGHGQQQQARRDSATAAPAGPPPGPRELTEKEKMAQALFGGLGGPSSSSSSSASGGGASSSSSSSRPAWGSASAGSGSGVKTAPAATKPASTTTTKPTATVNLLDLDDDGGSSNTSASAPAPPATAAVPPTRTAPPPKSSKATGGGAQPSLLDFNDEEVVSKQNTPPGPPPPSSSSASAAPIDPFAALSSGPSPPTMSMTISGSSSSSTSSSSTTSSSPAFTYKGQPMSPLQINTQEFGTHWTKMRFQAPATITQTTFRTLESLAGALQQVGLHVVESIPRTSEVIAAGRLPGGPPSQATEAVLVLVHTKLHTQRGAADCLIKCDDNVLGQQLGGHLTRALR